jgi:Asp-tRNA(Asn)/Glu-tRNA(Gln) amidotransferase A subunit family amidase
MHFETVTELCSSLRQRKFSATELTRTLLERIEAVQPALNAFISIEREAAPMPPPRPTASWPRRRAAADRHPDRP